MGLLDIFRNRTQDPSAKMAKERLQILIAHERAQGQHRAPTYLPEMQKEILEVIRKYVHVEDDAVKFEVEHNEQYELFELNITLPEKLEGTQRRE
ncbi:MAG: cell division topological specificity factor MinE [Halothiobacillaceae bacterium]|nr:cell division topological specificity factor MinE [Halothiobacillaceae bacterium]